VLQRLERHCNEAARRGLALDIQRLLTHFTVDVTTNLAFGIDLNTLQGDGGELQEHLSKLFPMLSRRLTLPIPCWRYVKLPIDRDFDCLKAASSRC